MPVTRSLRALLNAVLTPNSGRSPLLDFQVCEVMGHNHQSYTLFAHIHDFVMSFLIRMVVHYHTLYWIGLVVHKFSVRMLLVCTLILVLSSIVMFFW